MFEVWLILHFCLWKEYIFSFYRIRSKFFQRLHVLCVVPALALKCVELYKVSLLSVSGRVKFINVQNYCHFVDFDEITIFLLQVCVHVSSCLNFVEWRRFSKLTVTDTFIKAELGQRKLSLRKQCFVYKSCYFVLSHVSTWLLKYLSPSIVLIFDSE